MSILQQPRRRRRWRLFRLWRFWMERPEGMIWAGGGIVIRLENSLMTPAEKNQS